MVYLESIGLKGSSHDEKTSETNVQTKMLHITMIIFYTFLVNQIIIKLDDFLVGDTLLIYCDFTENSRRDFTLFQSERQRKR